jgi:hypothetical protein
MRKLFSLFLAMFLATPAFAQVAVNNNGTQSGIANTILYNCPSGTQLVYGSQVYSNCGNLMSTGTANGGGVSLATTDAGIPLNYDFVEKAISNLGTLTDTLANGSPGQLLTIEIGTVSGSGTWKVTPATSFGFSSITFNTQGQTAMFLYTSSGWILLSYDSPTSTLPVVVVK